MSRAETVKSANKFGPILFFYTLEIIGCLLILAVTYVLLKWLESDIMKNSNQIYIQLQDIN